MTSDEFSALADRTGLSDARLGFALGSQGSRANVAAKVRKWRNGMRPVTEDAASRLRALVAALDGRSLPDTDAAIAAALAPKRSQSNMRSASRRRSVFSSTTCPTIAVMRCMRTSNF